ncbi:hypothetical protein EW093_08295 [Thiospirochaeta perfilievii]|uniref:RecC C-terminal domain-containing protein n=1 Tax=Thiospirochaeta perfilievii TaxID=252967 RepID=A0A5C1QDH9_9SPIO|nr:exodeoxyribonuclease V subunit gamma [Thiospirochaeta perfilievii]QEN04706.1 hypothetical protein EW093_08295 [Thiospirochaeta perfilievii]
MGYKIYHSNNLHEFIRRYSSLFHSNDLFGEKVITVVQNRNIASWLQLELTKTDGISMDLQFEYPENAVKNLVLGYKKGHSLFGNKDNLKSILFMDSLKIVLYKSLEELLINDKTYPNLFNYVKGSSQRLFQLSDSIAGLFYHYGMNCPLMVESWDRGELYKNDLGFILREEDQLWQMSLWNTIFNDSNPYLHISRVLNEVLKSGESYDPALSPFGRCKIILFGSSFLGESAIKFFNYLSRDIEVLHFILTPSLIYRGEEFVKPKSLLSRFSGLINGFTSISRESSFNKERESFFVDYTSGTLLDNLKDGIKNNSLEEYKRESPIEVDKDDSSIRICKITGGWREIEVLKEKILYLLDSDKELKLTDIGVVAPEISDYSSFIEGVFPDRNIAPDGSTIFGKRDLPYNIMGVKGGEDSPFIRGLLSLLDLPGSDFNRKDLINILSNPCFMERFSLTNSSRELFLEIIDSLNIKWAIDGEHRIELGYTGEDFNTWESGFKRFLLGIALDREDSNLVPFNITDSQGIESIGNLVNIVRSLYSDLWSINSLSLNIDEWVLFIETVMDTYLKPVKDDLFDERERLSVKHQYRNILNLLDDLKDLSNFKNKEIPFAVFRSLLKEFIVKSGNNKGRYLTQGVTFSSLKPLRAVPFKHIFVLGLNEDVFPGKEKIPSYDLRGIYDQKIDLSRRQNDKFAFLELILSAQKSLTLFYNGKNLISGEELQPSVVINDLMETIELNFSSCVELSTLIIEEHPLHNFDPKYFDSNNRFISFDKRAFNTALAYIGEKEEPKLIDLDEDSLRTDQVELTVNDLIQFIKNPVKTFFNKSEGIYLDNDTSIEEDIHENRDLDFISKWKFTNIVMEQGLMDDIPIDRVCDSFFSLAEQEGFFKSSPLTNNVRAEVEELVESVNQFLNENNLKGTHFKRVNRDLGGEYKTLDFNVNGISIKLKGELENLWVDNEGACFTTGITLGKKPEMSVKDKILPYIYSLIINSHNEMRETHLTAYSIGRNSLEPVIFQDKGDSLEVLRGIISLYVKNLVKPIPLYPEIMESDNVDDLKREWDKASSITMGFSLIKECPYIQKTYEGTIPDFNKDDVDLLFNSFYKKIVNRKAKK